MSHGLAVDLPGMGKATDFVEQDFGCRDNGRMGRPCLCGQELRNCNIVFDLPSDAQETDDFHIGSLGDYDHRQLHVCLIVRDRHDGRHNLGWETCN